MRLNLRIVVVTALSVGLAVGSVGMASAASHVGRLRVVPVPSKVASTSPVMGVKHTFGPDSTGWGQVRPAHLFNGGDPSGDISKIHWSSWGGKVAAGLGKNAIFKPGGGYYPKPVKIQLRASDLGRCTPGGRLTYRRLHTREPSKPGGPYGKWYVWTSYHRNLCKHFD
jgi:hypothetical protein